MKKVTIFTDGACKGNPGIGGWGALLIYGKHQKTIKGASHNTTNNKMELTSVIEALSLLKYQCEVDLMTDSKYVKDGVTKWLINWKRNNWLTSEKKPVKNQELWQKIDQLNQFHKVNWQWIKGHNGNPGNEMADLLANSAIEELIKK